MEQLCAISKAQGHIGEVVEICGVVIAQDSYPSYTPRGVVYSHVHLIEDLQGNLYRYKGSSFYPKHSRIHFRAIVKGYQRGDKLYSTITVIRAPKNVH